MDKLCRMLEIDRSGYYACKIRGVSQRERKEQELLCAIVTLHQKYPAMGLDSIYHTLKKTLSCSRNRIHRLMKKYNIHSIRKNAYKSTTNSNHSYPICENLLKRNFLADTLNSKWVGDITYIKTDEGWLYLATVKDLCTRKIVGYAFSSHIDADLVVSALKMAYNRQNPDGKLIFHSDRGVQYASNKYRKNLAEFNITQSMSRKGDPYDNAVAENFFSCLKNELIHHKHYKTRAEAKADIFAYIETYYNSVRPHSGIGWMTPNEYEEQIRSVYAAKVA